MATVLRLDWNDNPVAQQVTVYNVYRSLDGGATYVKVDTTGDSFWELPNPGPGVYRFKVSASNLAGEGPLSEPVASPDIPTAPDGLAVTVEIV